MAKKSSTVHKGQVKLREKKLANGGSSLYLDILDDGKRRDALQSSLIEDWQEVNYHHYKSAFYQMGGSAQR